MNTNILIKIAFSFFLFSVSYGLCLSQNNLMKNIGVLSKMSTSDLPAHTKRYIKKGDRLLQNGYVAEALNYYHKAYELDTSNFSVNQRIGVCFIQLNQYSKAIYFLLAAKQESGNEHVQVNYHLARAYHLSLRFSDAIEQYSIYKQHLKDSTAKKQIERLINQCQNGVQITKQQRNIEITNLGGKINSSYPDYGMAWLPNETILFTSKRDNTTGGERNKTDNAYYEDIYISHCTLGQRKQASNEGIIFNSKSNDAIIGFNKHLNQLFVYKDNGNGDIYVTTRKNKKWSNLASFSDVINSRFQETTITITNDGNEVYFVSTRNIQNGKDIYYATRDEDGKWNMPHNIGSVINTPFDEECVFLSDDNKKLYFSSKGHNTMGGYDIFVSELDKNGLWSTPVNLGAPINTPGDDIFYYEQGNRAFYASIKENGNGDLDIYEINYSPKSLKKKVDTIFIEIRDTVYSHRTVEQLTTKQANSMEHYITDKSNVTIANFPPIHFATSKYTLCQQHCDTLQGIIQYLKNNPKLNVQITGHCDNTGSLHYNVELSKKRANTVAAYFVQQGIAKTRMKCYGLADLLPVAGNLSENNRQKNRRVSFVIYAPGSD